MDSSIMEGKQKMVDKKRKIKFIKKIFIQFNLRYLMYNREKFALFSLH